MGCRRFENVEEDLDKADHRRKDLKSHRCSIPAVEYRTDPLVHTGAWLVVVGGYEGVGVAPHA